MVRHVVEDGLPVHRTHIRNRDVGIADLDEVVYHLDLRLAVCAVMGRDAVCDDAGENQRHTAPVACLQGQDAVLFVQSGKVLLVQVPDGHAARVLRFEVCALNGEIDVQRDGLALRLLADLEAHTTGLACSQAILSVEVRRHQNPPSRFTSDFAQKAKSRKISKKTRSCVCKTHTKYIYWLG